MCGVSYCCLSLFLNIARECSQVVPESGETFSGDLVKSRSFLMLESENPMAREKFARRCCAVGLTSLPIPVAFLLVVALYLVGMI